jgi:histidine ammonia-lyase
LPPFLIGNEDGTESGLMIVQYTAAAIVNDLASRAMPASVYSIPTSANAEDHVSMGANEARHVLAMTDDLAKVLALELMTAAQALDLRRDMINAARALAGQSDAEGFAAKVRGEPKQNDEAHAAYLQDIEGLRAELAAAGEFGRDRRLRPRTRRSASASGTSSATARWMAMYAWRCSWSTTTACWMRCGPR